MFNFRNITNEQQSIISQWAKHEKIYSGTVNTDKTNTSTKTNNNVKEKSEIKKEKEKSEIKKENKEDKNKTEKPEEKSESFFKQKISKIFA